MKIAKTREKIVGGDIEFYLNFFPQLGQTISPSLMT
jgi:hypothetical protein